MSFFDFYAKYIQPSDTRTDEQGDYYASPLTALGLDPEIAFQIAKNIMQLNDGSTTLAKIAILRDNWPKDPIYQAFKQKNPTIVLAETLLRTSPNTASSLNPDFFNGIDDYFQHSSDTHAAKEQLFSYLVLSCLACLWCEYQQRGLPLPQKTSLHKRLLTISGEQVSTEQVIEAYHSFYQIHNLHQKLVSYLDQNLQDYLDNQSHLRPARLFNLHAMPEGKAKHTIDHVNGYSFDIHFLTAPWQRFLHKG